MLARVVNGYACLLVKRGVLECIVGTPPGACSRLQRGVFNERWSWAASAPTVRSGESAGSDRR